jgi:F-type H+-transporting ATPase subunit gamma
VIALGKIARQFCRGTQCGILHAENFGTSIPPYSIVYTLIEIVLREFLSASVSSFQILYNEFESVYTQTPRLLPVLPIRPEAPKNDIEYVFEPGYASMLEELLPYYLEVVLYETIIEAFTSEQAARMMAMNNAKTNAREIAEYLTLLYNKSRQEKITDELQVLANYAG